MELNFTSVVLKNKFIWSNVTRFVSISKFDYSPVRPVKYEDISDVEWIVSNKHWYLLKDKLKNDNKILSHFPGFLLIVLKEMKELDSELLKLIYSRFKYEQFNVKNLLRIQQEFDFSNKQKRDCLFTLLEYIKLDPIKDLYIPVSLIDTLISYQTDIEEIKHSFRILVDSGASLKNINQLLDHRSCSKIPILACKNSNLNLIKYLYEQDYFIAISSINEAIKSGSGEVVEYLLSKGFSLGPDSLYNSISSKSFDLVLYIIENDPNIIRQIKTPNLFSHLVTHSTNIHTFRIVFDILVKDSKLKPNDYLVKRADSKLLIENLSNFETIKEIITIAGGTSNLYFTHQDFGMIRDKIFQGVPGVSRMDLIKFFGDEIFQGVPGDSRMDLIKFFRNENLHLSLYGVINIFSSVNENMDMDFFEYLLYISSETPESLILPCINNLKSTEYLSKLLKHTNVPISSINASECYLDEQPPEMIKYLYYLGLNPISLIILIKSAMILKDDEFLSSVVLKNKENLLGPLLNLTDDTFITIEFLLMKGYLVEEHFMSIKFDNPNRVIAEAISHGNLKIVELIYLNLINLGSVFNKSRIYIDQKPTNPALNVFLIQNNLVNFGGDELLHLYTESNERILNQIIDKVIPYADFMELDGFFKDLIEKHNCRCGSNRVGFFKYLVNNLDIPFKFTHDYLMESIMYEYEQDYTQFIIDNLDQKNDSNDNAKKFLKRIESKASQAFGGKILDTNVYILCKYFKKHNLFKDLVSIVIYNDMLSWLYCIREHFSQEFYPIVKKYFKHQLLTKVSLETFKVLIDGIFCQYPNLTTNRMFFEWLTCENSNVVRGHEKFQFIIPQFNVDLSKHKDKEQIQATKTLLRIYKEELLETKRDEISTNLNSMCSQKKKALIRLFNQNYPNSEKSKKPFIVSGTNKNNSINGFQLHKFKFE